MGKIDNQMLQIHQRCTQNATDHGTKISERDALLLIQRAEEINTSSGSSFKHESRRGNKYLLNLVDQNKSDFSPESQKLIRNYIRTGQVPRHDSHSTPNTGFVPGSRPGASAGSSTGGGMSAGMGGGMTNGAGTGMGMGGTHGTHGGSHAHGGTHGSTHGGSHGGAHGSTHGGSHTHGGTHGGSGAGMGGSRPGSGTAGGAPAVPPRGNPGVPSDRPPMGTNPTTPNRPNPGTTAPGTTTPVTGETGEVNSFGKVILDFTANKSTWGCHWFPMQETTPGGDPVNNLYAINGPLHKLDMVSGGNAREFEYANNRKGIEEGDEFSWWGHCNNASEAACILQAPKHGVTMTAKDGSQIKFTKGDIQGLLVKVSSSLIDKVDFKGERFNEPSRDNENDPLPAMFIEVMQEWAKDGLPFVLDIDRREQVWNFPYDRVKISESDKMPEGAGVSVSGNVKYYHIDMSGTGFDEKRRVYECWVQRDSNGAVLDSGWIKTPNTHNNPDFMWRPHPIGNGDLNDKSLWHHRGNPTNPQVDPQLVYEIYMKSLA